MSNHLAISVVINLNTLIDYGRYSVVYMFRLGRPPHSPHPVKISLETGIPSTNRLPLSTFSFFFIHPHSLLAALHVVRTHHLNMLPYLKTNLQIGMVCLFSSKSNSNFNQNRRSTSAYFFLCKLSQINFILNNRRSKNNFTLIYNFFILLSYMELSTSSLSDIPILFHPHLSSIHIHSIR